MPGFCTDAEVGAYVKAVLAKVASIDLKDYWTDFIVPAANVQAYNYLLAHWLKNGYTAGQIAGWDFGANFQKRLAAFFAIARIAPLDSQVAISNYQLLDPRKELVGEPTLGILPQPLIASGVFVDPAGQRGQVTFGAFDESDDTWVPDLPFDTRLGEPTRT